MVCISNGNLTHIKVLNIPVIGNCILWISRANVGRNVCTKRRNDFEIKMVETEAKQIKVQMNMKVVNVFKYYTVFRWINFSTIHICR